MLKESAKALSVNEEAIQRFAASVRGNVLTPGDSSYDQARTIYNIALCTAA